MFHEKATLLNVVDPEVIFLKPIANKIDDSD